jgi:hypothetical protein
MYSVKKRGGKEAVTGRDSDIEKERAHTAFTRLAGKSSDLLADGAGLRRCAPSLEASHRTILRNLVVPSLSF